MLVCKIRAYKSIGDIEEVVISMIETKVRNGSRFVPWYNHLFMLSVLMLKLKSLVEVL